MSKKISELNILPSGSIDAPNDYIPIIHAGDNYRIPIQGFAITYVPNTFTKDQIITGSVTIKSGSFFLQNNVGTGIISSLQNGGFDNLKAIYVENYNRAATQTYGVYSFCNPPDTTPFVVGGLFVSQPNLATASAQCIGVIGTGRARFGPAGSYGVGGYFGGGGNVIFGPFGLSLTTSVGLIANVNPDQNGPGNIFEGRASVNTVRFVITGEGKVGILNSTPANYLDVNGTSRFNGNVQVTGSVLVTGSVITNKLQMTSGAVNGYVLTSDSNGNAYWASWSGGTTKYQLSLTRSSNFTVNGGTIDNPQTYIYDVIDFSTFPTAGSEYNTTTGVFTAPLTGVYLVHYNVLVLNTSISQIFRITNSKNGKGMEDRNFGLANANIQLSTNFSIKLDANETMTLRIENAGSSVQSSSDSRWTWATITYLGT